ncbi:helix-turn-helix domain-containing protein [Streptomyces sp. DSM 41524]|uniref:Helix-turn-helix domain-containing protein n=1 Tax=Streptomyces asiaticus subsp. ignotus TaxID=3098222 RepID=A0ABU7Q5Q1_9ACTN|nr:TetR/AcrR family transcriptional regulator [Streptomyces sp. DASNCL29]MEE4596717.1 helix-turn-helix domain-containing protein [Streptomyces sp. DSM 41524]TMU98774.1 TetR family transcriptional regulator [Streptomyces sp. DASNCL29]
MPNRGDRGGAQTRARIASVATQLFLERGFDDVTINEVAAAAGVSKVTVFAHFDRKEDLLFDRFPEALDTVRTVLRERADDLDPVEAMRRAALALATERHVLSGLGEGVEPFLRTVMASPALIARLRLFASEMEETLAAELDADTRFSGDSTLTAALLVAAYRTVAVDTVKRRLAGENLDEVGAAHRRRLTLAFDALAGGLNRASRAGS